MKCLMPINQREAIAQAIDGKRYVEWGVGGTTIWLTRNARPRLGVSVEHDGNWATACNPGEAWTVLHAPCSPGQNATIGEEHADGADNYIAAGATIEADVYLIDGVVRAQCLDALVATGRPMVVFIHDTQRDWYDDAIERAVGAGFVRQDYPEGDDYPGCLLTKLERCC